jgi:hypothetical protein
MIVPGGGISLDGERWIARKPNFFLPVFVLSKLFRRLMLEKLLAAHATGKLNFFGDFGSLADRQAFVAFLAPLKKTRWFVYSKRPFAGPKAVLAYLSRYTHRVAISNSRLISADANGVTFRWKDYRAEGRERFKTMTLATGEFIRRFLMHVLPKGLHRIRHYGLFANGSRAETLARIRTLLEAAADAQPDRNDPPQDNTDQPARETLGPCPCCGGHRIIIEIFEPPHKARAPPSAAFRTNTA